MSNTIGMAGISHGYGRVAAVTKAINVENLQPSNTDTFIRFFLNSCLWACRNNGSFSKRVAIFANSFEAFDERIVSLFSSIGFTPTLIDPWYSNQSFVSNNSLFGYYDLYVLIPSYSAFDGSRMPDLVQERIIQDISYYGAGLFLAEWFHVLHNVKKSFSLSSDDNDGLFSLSPFLLGEEKVVFTDADEIIYANSQENDSLSFGISPTFTLDNFALDTPFLGHISQLGEVRENATIYWITDVPSIATTTTTTTTTEPPPEYEDIKLKVFDLNLLNSCGPQKLYLEGENKDLFQLEGNELFLTKLINEPQKITVNVVAEDYFENERFTRSVEQLSINFTRCNEPITLPINGDYPAYSYRLNHDKVKQIWGDFAPVGVISPFIEWEFSGKGTPEEPAFACLGGLHSDINALWMQVNTGGEINATVSISSENPVQSTSFSDVAQLFLIENSGEFRKAPSQHYEDLFNLDQENPHIKVSHQSLTPFFQRNNTYSFKFNSKYPNAVDEDGNKLWDDIFLLLIYKKDVFRTENQDKVCLSAFFGTTTTTPPPEESYTVFIQNSVPDIEVRRLNGIQDTLTAFSFKSVPTDAPTNNVFSFVIRTTQSGVKLENIVVRASDIEDFFGADPILVNDSEFISISFRNITDTSITVDVTLNTMPVSGGESRITITGETVTTTTTTTTQPPRYPITVEFTKDVTNAYLDTYKQKAELQVGVNHLFRFQWRTSDNYYYYPKPDCNPVAGITLSCNEPLLFRDRPTVTEIVSATWDTLVKLPTEQFSDNIDVRLQNESWNNDAIRITKCCSHWSSCNDSEYRDTCGYIYVNVYVDPAVASSNGADILLRLGAVATDEDEPDLRTTTSTTPRPSPCDNLIYIICQQTLDCSIRTDGSCGPSTSSQTIISSSCCDISSSDIMDIIRQRNLAGPEATLSDMYSSQCASSGFDLMGPCLPVDKDGNCQQTIHSQIIDTINCSFSENPLP